MRLLPWLAALANVAFFVALGMPPRDRDGTMHHNEAARLPVVDGGRVKPLDTFARVNLQVISVKQELKTADGKTLPPVAWLLDVWSSPHLFEGTASEQRVFRIEDDQLLSFLKLEQRPGSYRYSLKELRPRYSALIAEYGKVSDKPQRDRDAFEQHVVELSQKLSTYDNLLRLERPLIVPPQEPGGEWQPVARSLEAARHDLAEFAAQEMRRQQKRLSPEDIADLSGRIDKIAREKIPADDPARLFLSLTRAYAGGDVAAFNDAIAEMTEQARANTSAWDFRMTRFEAAFNHLAPFYWCMVVYVVVIPVAGLYWLTGADAFRRTAVALVTTTFVLHSAALVARMLIQWRPPVTNLYSSAVFIGWGCAGLLLLIEWLYRNGIAVCLSGVTGALSLVIAHFLAQSGDTLEMMQAVLDTNFWLATHVTAVTLGYTATFVAGFLATAYILLRFASPRFDDGAAKTLGTMTYGVVCFATLVSFLGTVLGGIWADQSWGRFWGWDPKENGAVLVVIWNALILHARWGGLVKQHGVAVLAVFGNIITAWSWFGTNQLGVGLHAYGFNNTVAKFLVTFVLFNLAVMTVGCLPRSVWISQALRQSHGPKARRQSPTPVA